MPLTQTLQNPSHHPKQHAPFTAATQGIHSTASELLVYRPHSWKNKAYKQSGPQQESADF
jgi:hypothetical protein